MTSTNSAQKNFDLEFKMQSVGLNAWFGPKQVLKDINLNIKHGEFVFIVGDVGAGKSSLLSALIGDLNYIQEGFLREYENTPLSEEFKLKIKEHSKIKYAPHEAPIQIYGNLSYVQ